MNAPGRPAPQDPGSDTVDLRELVGSVARGWRYVAAGALAGLLVALLLLALLPARFEGTTTVLLREYTDLPSMASGGRGGSGGNGGGGLSLGGLSDLLSLDGALETELEILTSRAVVGAVVDSLGLQAEITRPRGIPVDSLFPAHSFSSQLGEGSYTFKRDQGSYRVRGPGGFAASVEPGGAVDLPGARLSLRHAGLPPSFRVRLSNRQDVVRRIRRIVDADQAAGDIAELEFRGADPRTAAAVPNAMVAEYLSRRTTTDRGLNQRRYEFLSRHADSVATELAIAEGRLREHQERSGILDPEYQGEAEMEQALTLRARLENVEMDLHALDEILRGVPEGEFSSRELGGYPTLMSNPAINNLLSRLFGLETERTNLLERRTESDPDVVALDRSIADVERQLVGLSRSYRDGLRRQREEIAGSLRGHRSTLDALPAQAEESFRRRRDVERLSETLLALQTGLVQARIAAIAEGGDVRQIDVAEIPERRAFPRAVFFLPIGLTGGLLVGIVLALGRRYLARSVDDPETATLDTGLPAFLTAAGRPVLVAGWRKEGYLLVVPAEAEVGAGHTGRKIAETSSLQGRAVAVVDLEGAATPADVRAMLSAGDAAATPTGEPGESASTALIPYGDDGAQVATGYSLYRWGGNGASIGAIREAVGRLGDRYERVIVVLPPLGNSVTTALLGESLPVIVVARHGRTSRVVLRDTVESLREAGLDPAAVAITPADEDADGRSSA